MVGLLPCWKQVCADSSTSLEGPLKRAVHNTSVAITIRLEPPVVDQAAVAENVEFVGNLQGVNHRNPSLRLAYWLALGTN